MNQSQSNHIAYLSFMSVISSIAVIFLHTNDAFWQFSYNAYWKSANIIESIFYFAVPVFFMITGATLMNYRKRYTTFVFFKKRFSKTVIPYFAWSLLGLLFCTYYLKWITPSHITPKYFVNGLLQGKLYASVFWFFIPLFMIYLSIPLFSAVEEKYRKQVFSYLVIATFILHFVIPFLITLSKKNIHYSFSMPSMGSYLFYALVGSLLVENDLTPKTRIVIYCGALIGLLVHMIGTYILSIKSGMIDSTYKGYLNLPCVLYSVGVFIFLKQIGIKIMSFTIPKQVVLFLKDYTFPFYLIHLFVLHFLTRAFSLNKYSLAYRLLLPFAIIIIIIPITWILRKIPLIRKLLP